MYLLVFVTLVVGIIGIYTQSLSVQTARLYSHQTGLANTMMRWHETAVSQARFATDANTLSTALPACDLTQNGVVGSVCAQAGNAVYIALVSPGMGICTPPIATPCWTSLPAGYVTAPYTFYSVYYQTTNGQKYVATFVPPPTIGAANPAPGFITLPGAGGTQVGVTMSELVTQMRSANVSPLYYGITTQDGGGNTQLVTGSVSSGNGAASAPLAYSLPNSIPPNAVVILSGL